MRRLVLLPLGFALVLAGCVTTEGDGDPVTGTHLGMENQFLSADADQSGFLTREEIAGWNHEQLLTQYDLDRDHQLSEQEWDNAHPSPAAGDVKFSQIDRDKDKKISRAEALKWVSENVTFTKAFSKYDSDGDSRLYWKNLEEKAPTELRVTIFSLPI